MKSATSTNDLTTTRRDALKTGIGAASFATVLTRTAAPVAVSTATVPVATTTSQAQQACVTASDVTEPATGIVMFPEYAQVIAQMAYIWGWPMINMINRRAAITQAPPPGHLNGVLPAA